MCVCVGVSVGREDAELERRGESAVFLHVAQRTPLHDCCGTADVAHTVVAGGDADVML